MLQDYDILKTVEKPLVWPDFGISTVVGLKPEIRSQSHFRTTVISETSEDLSWADSTEFKAKMDRAFEDIESGRFDSVETIEELIEFIDAQQGKAKEGPKT